MPFLLKCLHPILFHHQSVDLKPFWTSRLPLALPLTLLPLILTLGGCRPAALGYSSFNSRYTDEQPALSGNGRYVALISNRNGHQELALYDIQRNKFVVLPQLNRRRRLLESPSLSRSARYIAYLVSDRGRPRIEVYDRRSKRHQVLTSGGHGAIRNPSISLDGRYVAFESSRQGQWDIQVIDRGNKIELDLPAGVRQVQPGGNTTP